jgi:hypothetical protein
MQEAQFNEAVSAIHSGSDSSTLPASSPGWFLSAPILFLFFAQLAQKKSWLHHSLQVCVQACLSWFFG